MSNTEVLVGTLETPFMPNLLSGRAFLVAALLLASSSLGQVHPAAVPTMGHRAVLVTVSTPRQLQTVLALTDDVRTCEGAGIGTFEVGMSPEQYAAFRPLGIPHQVVIEDIGAQLNEVLLENDRLRQGDDPAWFTVYRTNDEVNTRLAVLAGQFPTLATLSDIGTTFEGRTIKMIRITGPGSTANRPAIVINGDQHAREWATPMATMFAVDRLLETYATDPNIKKLVDRIDFYIIPIVNPDGYVYSHTVNANWRKNRRTPPAGSTCFGVDLNRNWAFQWGNNNGSSPDPCSDTYRGTAGFTESEIVAVKNVVDSIAGQGRLKAHLDVHANAKMLLSPWGYTTSAPPGLPLMNQLGLLMANAIATTRGTVYQYGQGSVILYINSGNARDYAYGQHGVLGWTIELAGNSFMPPQAEILPIAEEAFEGIKALAGYFASPLSIAVTGGAPAFVAPNQATNIPITITNTSGTYEPGTAKLYTRVGTSGPFTASSLTPLGGVNFQGSLPGAPCGSAVQFYIEASTTQSVVVTHPDAGVAGPLSTTAMSQVVVFTDNFESNLGWTVQNHTSLTSGAWVRVDPIGTMNGSVPAQPEDDYTPNPGVNCYVTGQGVVGGALGAADVDGGPTWLISPTIDLSGATGAAVQYARWLYNDDGDDLMTIDVSNNNGTTWVPAGNTGNTSGWKVATLNIHDFVPLTAQVRLRIGVADQPNNSITEGAIDDLQIVKLECPATCYPDCNGDGLLNLADFGCFQTNFATGNAYADCNGDTMLNLADFGCFQTKFAVGCP